jgi:hypothetical protein
MCTEVFCVLKGGALVLFPEPIGLRREFNEGRPGLCRMSDNHLGFNKSTNPAVIGSMRTWITQEQTIQDQVMLKNTKPGVYRVTGNIQ